MSRLEDKIEGALFGGAIGDAMGAPVEGMPTAAAVSTHGRHDFNSFIAPGHGGDPNTGKGNGRITDDTLMTEALMRAYADAGTHLDAYGYKRFLLPHVKDKPVWIPEWQREGALFDRLWFPEKYPWMRMVPANADPRTAGVGNMVNCGVAMWMMPVGAVNAGDPAAAYQEAVLIGSAHNESFAVEAGAVMAAGYAEAFAADADIASVVRVSRESAQDGTRPAICAACDATDSADSLEQFVGKVRAAVEPYDQRSGHTPDDKPLSLDVTGDVGRPSRVASIEELPVALAALRYGEGDALKTLRAGVCYGRDCDSIAAMALGLLGALSGVAALPSKLCKEVNAANRRDFAVAAGAFIQVVRRIAKADRAREDRRRVTIGA